MSGGIETYSTGKVCKALGISQATLNTWAHRGALVNLDAAHTIAGRSRRFTKRDVMALALIKFCADQGIAAARASGWASIASQAHDEYPSHVRRLIVRFYQDGERITESILFNDDVMQEPAPGGEISRFEFDLHSMFIRARLRLAETYDRDPDEG